MGNIDKNRRKWLSLGGIVLGASMMPTSVLAMVSTPKPRILSFYNVNTNERLSGEFSAVGIVIIRCILLSIHYLANLIIL